MDSMLCSICKCEYDQSIKVPRVLTNCGHTYCQMCILKLLNNNTENSENKLVCPEDNILYTDITSNEVFPINLKIINMLNEKTNRNNSIDL